MKILDKIIKLVGVSNYDPSDIELVIAGYSLNDFTSVVLTPNQRRKTEQGVDPLYHTYVDIPSYCNLSVSILPACADLEFMEGLQDAMDRMKGYFEVMIKTNGRFIGVFDCYFDKDSSENLNDDPVDKTYDMIAVKQEDSVIRDFEGVV